MQSPTSDVGAMRAVDNNMFSNFSFGNLPIIKHMQRVGKEVLNKFNLNINQNLPVNDAGKTLDPTHTNKLQSLVNTNSNININQPMQSSPLITQGALNTSRETLTQGLNKDIKESMNLKLPQTSNQTTFQGPKDLPSYAGIASITLRSWIANQENKSYARLETLPEDLRTTLEGIKGFQRRSYNGQDDSSGNQQKFSDRIRNLIILSHIFSSYELPCLTENEALSRITGFQKLGSDLSDSENLFEEYRMLPPAPSDIQKLSVLDPGQIKFLYQLLSLPNEFPESLRIFAKEKIEINPNDLKMFLEHRLELVQEQLIGQDANLNKIISNFVPLLDQNNYSLLLPLVLLYLPFPFPNILKDYDYLANKKRKEQKKEKEIIASCDVYYFVTDRGRFLLKFELNSETELSFSIETSPENADVVQALEQAIAEAMFLLKYPPNLTDLNVLLTNQIYEATDLDEELSIVSTGPLRLEIVLALYSCLVILNKLNTALDPSGLIEMD